MKKNAILNQLNTEVEGSRESLIMRCPVCEKFAARSRVAHFSDYSTFNALKAGIYERSMQSALRRLKRHFNRCTECGRWVCDDCFLCSGGGESLSLCAECAKKKRIEGVSTGETNNKGGKTDEM